MNDAVQDDRLVKFVGALLSNVMQANEPRTPLRVVVNSRTNLKGFEAFLGVSPLCWINLRLQWHGAGIPEAIILETFNKLGCRCDEWIGTEGSDEQVGIFSPVEKESQKIIFCSETNGAVRRCDFLIPVVSHASYTIWTPGVALNVMDLECGEPN
jgi:hypothetical protein